MKSQRDAFANDMNLEGIHLENMLCCEVVANLALHFGTVSGYPKYVFHIFYLAMTMWRS